MKYDNLSDIVKLDKKKIFIGCLFFVLLIVTLNALYNNEIKKVVTDLNYVDNSKVASRITISTYPVKMDNEGLNITDSSSYYFVMDVNGYLYVTYLSDEAYQEIIETSNIDTNPLVLYGVSQKIDKDIKASVIKTYNGLVDKEVLTDKNFSNYLRNYYLDTVNTYKNVIYQKTYSTSTLIVISSLFLIASCLAFYIAISCRRKSKLLLNSMDSKLLKSISSEIDSKDSLNLSNKNLILTKSYIIDYNNFLKIIKYSDIAWFYKKEVKDYGFFVSKRCVVVFDKYCNYVEIGNGLSARKKDKFNKVYNYIKDRCPKAIEGDSLENKEKYANMVKKYIK